MIPAPPTTSRPSRVTGFTLVECVMATLVVAGMMVTALTTVAFSVLAQGKAADRAVGGMYAEALIAEIMTQAYSEPGATVSTFGPDPGEGTSSRANWDDVDDYAGWNESPLQNKDGSVITNTTGWRRSVEVVWVTPTSPMTVSAVESGCKRVTVTVRHNNNVVATR